MQYIWFVFLELKFMTLGNRNVLFLLKNLLGSGCWISPGNVAAIAMLLNLYLYLKILFPKMRNLRWNNDRGLMLNLWQMDIAKMRYKTDFFNPHHKIIIFELVSFPIMFRKYKVAFENIFLQKNFRTIGIHICF